MCYLSELPNLTVIMILLKSIGNVEWDAFHELNPFANGSRCSISLYFCQLQASFMMGFSMWLSHRHLKLCVQNGCHHFHSYLQTCFSSCVPISVNAFLTHPVGFIQSSLSLVLPRQPIFQQVLLIPSPPSPVITSSLIAKAWAQGLISAVIPLNSLTLSSPSVFFSHSYQKNPTKLQKYRTDHVWWCKRR